MALNLRNEHLGALQPRVPANVSKFPFSSPITDDQISDQSLDSNKTATSSDLANSPQSSQNPFGDTESGNTSGQDEFHLERYSESSSWTTSEPAKHHDEQGSKHAKEGRDGSLERRKKPDLNIVTNFSRNVKNTLVKNATIDQVPARRPKLGRGPSVPTLESQPFVEEAVLRDRFRRPAFVNLSDLEGLRKAKKRRSRPKAAKGDKKSKTKPHTTSQETQVEQKRDNLGNNGILNEQPLREHFGTHQLPASRRGRSNIAHHLQAPEKGLDGVSPTVRSVVIGISVPEDEVEAHKPSDEASSALTLQTPVTPSIIVTPADATIGWSYSAMQGSSMRRPASSIYSQMPGAAYTQHTDAPPVPSLPHQRRKYPESVPQQPRHSIDTWEMDSPHQRPFSSETIIDDDAAHQTEARPLSAGSKDGVQLSSSDTGRPRSQGWWNLMLSPMLSRAGTNATRKTTSPMEEAPELPILATTTQEGLGLDGRTPTTVISPKTLRRAGLDNARSSTWSKSSQWERDREQADTLQRVPENAQDEDSPPHQDNESDHCSQVAMDASAKKQGLAAEYFQASAFDLLNPVPYFECVNHDCGKTLPKLGAFTKRPLMAKGSDEVLDLAAATSMDKRVTERSPQRGDAHLRSDSDSTTIEDDPIEHSPNVRKADARPILKALQPQKIDASHDEDIDEKRELRTLVARKEEPGAVASRSTTPPPYSSPPVKSDIPRYVGILPPNHSLVPSSPGPLSPEAQKAINPNRGIPMAQVHPPPATFINFSTTYPTDLPPRTTAVPVSLSDIESPAEVRRKAEARRQLLEQEDAVAHRTGGLWRGRGCFPKNGCFGRGGPAGRTRRGWYVVIAAGLILMIILVVVLATQLTRKGDQTPIQSQWLNLTGYPPMPTGISTIARPDIASSVTACVQPSSLWSCALPREDQAADFSGDSDQPNFRLEIRFRNGTVNANGTVPVSPVIAKRSTGSRRAALLRRQNDPFTNSLFQPNPAPPSLDEQTFLGNTTDNINLPFSGETTPFFITFLTSDPFLPEIYNDTNQPSRRRLGRQIGSKTGNIPAAAVLSDGTAAPANLLPSNPLPSSQPIKLYNRGLDTEHYGFYTYFDRSIFLKTTAQFNSTPSSAESGTNDDADNSNGGSSKQDANLRCTWAQTRFLVQIWTSPIFSGQLFPASNGTGPSRPANDLEGSTRPKEKSSATEFERPGSFPYPVTVILDRHGGDGSKKGVYCYGMDGQEKIVVSEKKLVAELRGAGGTLVNAAPGIFSNAGGNDDLDLNAGGIDGGTGGCGCEWRNWAGNGGQ
jgi:hypothetical protein